MFSFYFLVPYFFSGSFDRFLKTVASSMLLIVVADGVGRIGPCLLLILTYCTSPN